VEFCKPACKIWQNFHEKLWALVIRHVGPLIQNGCTKCLRTQGFAYVQCSQFVHPSFLLHSIRVVTLPRKARHSSLFYQYYSSAPGHFCTMHLAMLILLAIISNANTNTGQNSGNFYLLHCAQNKKKKWGQLNNLRVL